MMKHTRSLTHKNKKATKKKIKRVLLSFLDNSFSPFLFSISIRQQPRKRDLLLAFAVPFFFFLFPQHTQFCFFSFFLFPFLYSNLGNQEPTAKREHKKMTSSGDIIP